MGSITGDFLDGVASCRGRQNPLSISLLGPVIPEVRLGAGVAAALLMVALAGLVAAPAAALPPRGIVPAPQVPDPCGQTSPSILTFAATPSTVTLGQLIDLSWRVAA